MAPCQVSGSSLTHRSRHTARWLERVGLTTRDEKDSNVIGPWYLARASARNSCSKSTVPEGQAGREAGREEGGRQAGGRVGRRAEIMW